ncbi:GGDEF-domain containing protein, partial [Micromonospora aurantiaca]
MQSSPGMVTVAVLSGIAAAGAAVLLVASVRRRTGPRRPAHLLLAVAACAALFSLLVGLGGLLAAGDHWAHRQGQRTGWA